MTITEACDVNSVLDYLLGLHGPGGKPVDPEIAQAAACRLADRASKTLSAGLDAARVRAAWPKPGKRGKRNGR